jgi:hypothetical protein
MTKKKTREFHPDERRVSVSARLAAMVLPFVSTEETRYYLTGIQIEPHPKGGVILVATDGHRLGAVHDPEGDSNGHWICPVPDVLARACRKQTARKGGIGGRAEQLHFRGRAGYVTDALLGDANPAVPGEYQMAQAFCPPIDGTYPDWRRAVPKWPPRGKPQLVSFNAAITAGFIASASAAGCWKGSAPISAFPGSGPSDPMLIRIDLPAAIDFIGIFMPMRCGLPDPDRETGLPAWLREAGKKKRAPAKAKQAA